MIIVLKAGYRHPLKKQKKVQLRVIYNPNVFVTVARIVILCSDEQMFLYTVAVGM